MSAPVDSAARESLGGWLIVVGGLSAALAVVLLVVSFPLAPLPGVAAIVLGVLGLRRGARRHRGLYQTILAVGVFGVVLGVLAMLFLLSAGTGTIEVTVVERIE
ncbi:Na+-driven multidrug efflux pump [Actinoalloteichus hoggarensis]|uniref:Uncharacterized protein n=1 Tax=Actinoalloteichus hoggarensis TaxID=1470176 RepID=A0A221VZH0_9PSEU|nr:hypothetical protein [Actinoalloteichus hoggarensis]ASO18923.1 hypothetical protein AHOG_06355 [Actinoalloteichus hoggarensis]MBB5920158.1 Na+-driven multidrug efflux pump [Actinoalloteichus hoggarensis]